MVKANSRLVARGFIQREGINFGETFAPTMSSSCVRLLSAIACECDLNLCHFDVDQAFVQCYLNENVFLRLPKGCGKMSGKVVRLNKSLYGLKQASGTWHAHLTTCLQRLGFKHCLTDVCLFRLIENDRRVTVTAVVVHVDVHIFIKRRHPISGQSRVDRIEQLRTGCVYCRESAGTGPMNLNVVPNECCLGRSPWTNQYAPLFPTLAVGMKWAR